MAVLQNKSKMMNILSTHTHIYHSLVPRSPPQVFVVCSTRSGGSAWRVSHVIHGAKVIKHHLVKDAEIYLIHDRSTASE